MTHSCNIRTLIENLEKVSSKLASVAKQIPRDTASANSKAISRLKENLMSITNDLPDNPTRTNLMKKLKTILPDERCPLKAGLRTKLTAQKRNLQNRLQKYTESVQKVATNLIASIDK